ncbi:VOC family protein [Natronosalvus halobius]|uniref:VOC family protein n=1 Tax=Natronosalvus halobius TaxID=2953746 RepID=UPI0020A0B5DF|nr:VOC family protein [Natronosalvus halobius]USZ73694.1 VOC family protein [Natronosalvus halobius]
MSERTYPRGLAHVGLTVSNIDEAVEWYRDVFGFNLVLGPATIENEGFFGRQVSDLLGDFEEMKIAHLSTGNQVGIELFEFDDTTGKNDPDPFSPGLFHLSIIDPEVEELATVIDENGGDAYSDVWGVNSEDDDYKLAYCKDPWGNLIEVFSHSNERIYSNRE